MKLPSDLSGHVLVDALCRHWGYVKVNQVGSHIVVQTQEPTPHRVNQIFFLTGDYQAPEGPSGQPPRPNRQIVPPPSE